MRRPDPGGRGCRGVANVVVYVEVRGGAATAPSRFAIGEARRIADRLGATVYALLALGAEEAEQAEPLGRSLGEAGADRVLCCADSALGGAALDASHGPLLAAVAERLRPVLVLFPAGGLCASLGAPLAARTGAAYQPNAALRIVAGSAAAAEGEGPMTAGERLLAHRWRPGCDGLRTLDLQDCERPLVAGLAAGAANRPLGDPAAEVEMLSYPGRTSPAFEELSSEPDEHAALALAAVVIGVEAEAGPDATMALGSAAPDGAVVLADGGAPAAARLAACPGRLLLVGVAAAAALPVPVAPDAEVALVGGKPTEPPHACVTTFWRASGERALAALGAALGGPEGRA